jgi:hypothetical protein
VGGLLKDNGVTPADPFDVGSGRLDLSLASTVGLVFNETGPTMRRPTRIGGDPKTLNQPSVVNYSCVGQCSWTRTVKSVLATSATYTATVSGPAGMNITVTPSTFTIAPGAEQVLTINAEISALPVGAFAFGSVTLETETLNSGGSDFVEIAELGNASGGTWTQRTFDLSAYDGETVCLGFLYEGTFADGWYIDDVVITDTVGTVLTQDFTDTTFPPTDWSAFDYDGASPGWTRSTTFSNSAPASALHSWSGTTGPYQEGWLVTPQVTLGTDSTVTFYERISFPDDYVYHGLMISTGNCEPNPPSVGVSDTNIPVIVKPAAAILPEAVSIETMYRSGSEDVTGLLVGDEITDLTVEVGGLFAAQMVNEELSQDPTNADPYNGDGGTFFITTTVPAGALRLIAEITQSEAPDADLYVGTGDTPSLATEECFSAGGSWTEFCAIDNPTAGTWWMLVQNWQGSSSQPDWVTLAAAIVTDSDEGNMTVDGPATVAPGVEFDVTVNWDEPAMVAGEKWYGFFTLGTDAGNPGNIGAVWVDLLYIGAPAAAIDPTFGNYQPGDMVMTTTLTIDNVGDAPLTWSIVEQAPPTSAAAGTVATLPDAAILAGLTAQSGSVAASTARAPEAEVLWEQVVNGTSGIVSDFFIGSNAGAYSASDFVLTDFATIEYIYTPGFDNSNTLANQPAINWAIYANASGVPAGHPEDGTNMASALWSYSAPVNGTGVDITGNNIALDLLAAGENLNLAPGTYWLTVYPDYNVTGAGGARWNWYQAAQVGAQTQLVSPVVFAVGSWTSLGALGVTFFDTAFRIEGTPGQQCDPGDIPWLSLPETTGTIEGGESEAVPVVFDSTGLADGTYTGQLCITTNDPAEPVHFVDVELTVGEFASLRVAHLAPFAMDPGTAVTVTLNGAPALTNFAYGDSTSYIELVPDTYLVEIFPGSSATPAITATVNLMADMYYSAVAIGDGVNQDLALLALADDNTAPAAGKFHLRLGHLAPFAAGAATADIRLQDGTIVVDDVDFSDVTAFIPLDAGTYDLKITSADGLTTLIDPLPVTFAEGDIVTAFATGEGANQALGVFAWPVDVEGFFLPLFEEYQLFLPIIMK